MVIFVVKSLGMETLNNGSIVVPFHAPDLFHTNLIQQFSATYKFIAWLRELLKTRISALKFIGFIK